MHVFCASADWAQSVLRGSLEPVHGSSNDLAQRRGTNRLFIMFPHLAYSILSYLAGFFQHDRSLPGASLKGLAFQFRLD